MVKSKKKGLRHAIHRAITKPSEAPSIWLYAFAAILGGFFLGVGLSLGTKTIDYLSKEAKQEATVLAHRASSHHYNHRQEQPGYVPISYGYSYRRPVLSDYLSGYNV
jgi:hypothetical protein